eukprot:TCONS_00030468-protein
MQERMRWCQSKVKGAGRVEDEFWRSGISMYMDGTGFVYKKNAFDQARAVNGKVWRKVNEGLKRGCTGKCNKAGVEQAKYMVAISYDRGVVLCEPYKNLNGVRFSKMMDSCLPRAFQWSINPYDKLYVQDGCPVQNTNVAMEILEGLGAELVPIPPRSSDLNPIENFFHLVGKAVEKDSIEKNITSQTMEEFTERVKNIILNFDREVINK